MGGLTFGLTMRYPGIPLGMAVALSYCSTFGTLMPPLFEGTLIQTGRACGGEVVRSGIGERFRIGDCAMTWRNWMPPLVHEMCMWIGVPFTIAAAAVGAAVIRAVWKR